MGLPISDSIPGGHDQTGGNPGGHDQNGGNPGGHDQNGGNPGGHDQTGGNPGGHDQTGSASTLVQLYYLYPIPILSMIFTLF